MDPAQLPPPADKKISFTQDIKPGTAEDGRVALFSEGRLVAVAEQVGGVLKPRVVLADA
jgi:hypothetical protein